MQGVHVFESLGPSLGVRFMNHDRVSIQCGRELLEAGSKVASKSFVDNLANLEVLSTPPGEEPPRTLASLEAQMLARALERGEAAGLSPAQRRAQSGIVGWGVPREEPTPYSPKKPLVLN